MIENLNYIQANEAINGENGAPGELDVANRPLKELINLFNTGNANTQVRRINFKIPASQMITDGVVSDNIVSFDNNTGKYVKTNWQDKKALGIIDVENLTIYSFGEYKLKNKTDLIPGKAYFLSQLTDGEYVDQDSSVASATHIGVAITNDTIEINKYIDATFASVQIDDVIPSFINTYSSKKIEELLNTRATKIYFFSTANNVNSLAPAPASILNIPLNSAIVDLNIKRLYYKVSNSGLTSTSTLANAISSNAVVSTSVSWTNVTEKPNFATVATSGSYIDLINKPQVATATVDGLLSASDKVKLNSIDLQVQAQANSTVKRGTDGSIQAGGSSTFNYIESNTTTQPLGTKNNKLASTEFVQQNSVPIGTVIALATNNIPTGFIKCNGATISRTVYSGLFDSIGITFGAGDGSTTFKLPDLRGEFIRGFDDGRGVDAGRSFGSFQADELRSHNHPYIRTDYATSATDYQFAGSYTLSQVAVLTGNTGGNETRPRNIAMHYYIKY